MTKRSPAICLSRRKTGYRLLSALAVLLAGAAAVDAQVIYTVTDLGVLPGAGDSRAIAINDRGQVVGTSGNLAFRYTPGIGLISLGMLPGASDSSAAGLNSSGQVAGTSGNRLFRFTDGLGMVDLGLLPGYPLAQASGINDAGQISGSAGPVSSATARAFRYTDGIGMVDLAQTRFPPLPPSIMPAKS